MIKATKFNFLLVTGFFLFLLVWWALVNFGLPQENTYAKIFWSISTNLLLVIGAYFGLVVWRKNEIGKLRKAVSFFSLGMAAQVIANFIFGLYSFLLNLPEVYPSVADIFYIAAYVLYFFGAILLAVELSVFRKTTFWFWLIVFVCLFGSAYVKALMFTGSIFAWNLEIITNFGYVIFESAFVAVGLSAAFVTGFFKNHLFRSALLFILLGFLFQYSDDLYFLYAAQVGSWGIGGWGDVVYLLAYYPMAAAIILFVNTAAAVEILLITLNCLVFTQFLLSSKTSHFISDGVVLLLCGLISVVLFRRNRAEVRSKEDTIRLAALQESNRKLLELDHQKTEFLTIAAHQLRTPVSIIKNYVAMLDDGDYGQMPPEAKEVLKNMAESTGWLVRLGDEFVSIAHLEQGATKYHWSEVDLGSLIDGVVKEFRPKAALAGLTINWQRPAERCVIKGDEEKLRLTVGNILDNASKYGGESGVITVTLASEETKLKFTVADTGLGFSAQDREKFFQKFSRGDNARSVHVNKSTGLGLYIVRKFIEAHNGEVFAESEGLGKGSRFGFYISGQEKIKA